MSINIEKAPATSDHLQNRSPTWADVKRWRKERQILLDEMVSTRVRRDRTIISKAWVLWREMQAFRQAFAYTPRDSIAFSRLVQPVVSILASILRNEPKFNPDPRYVVDEEGLAQVEQIANELFLDLPRPDLPRLESTDRNTVESIASSLWERDRRWLCRIDDKIEETLKTMLGEGVKEVISGSESSRKVDLTRLWSIAQLSRPPYDLFDNIDVR